MDKSKTKHSEFHKSRRLEEQAADLAVQPLYAGLKDCQFVDNLGVYSIRDFQTNPRNKQPRTLKVIIEYQHKHGIVAIKSFGKFLQDRRYSPPS